MSLSLTERLNKLECSFLANLTNLASMTPTQMKNLPGAALAGSRPYLHILDQAGKVDLVRTL